VTHRVETQGEASRKKGNLEGKMFLIRADGGFSPDGGGGGSNQRVWVEVHSGRPVVDSTAVAVIHPMKVKGVCFRGGGGPGGQRGAELI